MSDCYKFEFIKIINTGILAHYNFHNKNSFMVYKYFLQMIVVFFSY